MDEIPLRKTYYILPCTERFDEHTKTTFWSEIDPWLTDSIYLHPKFKEYFDERAGKCSNGLYPTITI